MTLTSLADNSVCQIKNPKFIDKGLSFTSNKKFMALAERKDVKDYIGIYFTKDWSLTNVHLLFELLLSSYFKFVFN